MATIENDDQQPTTITTDTEVIREPEAPDDTGDGDGGEGAADVEGGQAAAPQRGQDGKFQRGPKAGNRRDRRQAFADTQRQIEERVSQRVAQQFDGMRSEFQRMIEAVRPREQPREQDQAPDEMQVISRAIDSEIAAFKAHDRTKGEFDLTRYNQLRSRMEQINGERGAIAALRRIGLTPEMLQQMRQPRQEGGLAAAQINARWVAVSSEFPWIKNAEHAKAVGAYRNYLINGLGRPDDLDTDREAAAHIAAQKRLGARVVPRGNEQRYAGLRGDDGAGERSPREVRLPKGALHGLSPDELKAVQTAVFSGGE